MIGFKNSKRQHQKKGKKQGTPISLSVGKSTTAATAGGHPDTNPLPDLPKLSICSSIKKLPLIDFIECSVNNNYRVLLISGEATDNELYQTWINLLSQYY